jgi:hypothetical protein
MRPMDDITPTCSWNSRKHNLFYSCVNKIECLDKVDNQK